MWMFVFKHEDLQAYKKEIKTRMEQALTQFHHLAYLTDPQNLDSEGKILF
jgi:hypothetical protein